MSDVTITYKGSPIATMDASGTKTLTTQGKYCEANIGVEYVKSAGPAGPTASAKAVNFRDYDGTIVDSYTAAEFAALTALPANPEHEGLTSQGWNWSLVNAKAYVAKYGRLEIGQMYITSDGKTRLHCHFEEARKSPYLGIGVDGTVVVDWGDETATDTLTGTSLTTDQNVQHVYASVGDYVITLTVVSGSFAFLGASTASHILKKETSAAINVNTVYANCLQRVLLGQGASIGSSAFRTCCSLSSITIPDGVTNIGDYAFYSCHSLTSITIPDGVTNIGDYAFYNCDSLTSITIPDSVTNIRGSVFYGCHSLTSITIPDSVTSIVNSAFYYCFSLSSIIIPDSVTSIGVKIFYNCYSLASITIPDSVTSIGGNAFYYNYGLGEIHFLPQTPPTVSASNAFSNLQKDCIIYVPAGTLEAYTTATNYPSSATYTYMEE